MKTLKHLLALSVAIALLAGCSSKKEEQSEDSQERKIEEVNNALLRTVDYNTPIVVVTNVNQIFSQTTNVPKQIKSIDTFGDLSSVVTAFSSLTNDDDVYWTFQIDNPDALEGYLGSANVTQAEERDGFTVCMDHNTGLFLMTKGNQAWLTDSPQTVERSVKAAATRHFGQDAAIASYMEQAHTANVAVNLAAIPEVAKHNEALKDGWGICNIDLNGKTIKGEGMTLNSNGEPVEYPGLQNINTGVLTHAIDNPNIAFAMGITKDFPWKSIQKMLSNGNRNSDFSQLTLFGRMIDGTVSISASLDPSVMDLRVSAVLQSTKADPTALIDMLQGFLGNQLADMGGGVYSFRTYESPTGYIYIADVDGSLYAGTHHPGQLSGNTNLKSVYEGNALGLSVNITPDLMQMFGNSKINFGIKGTVQSTSTKSKFQFSVTDTDKSIMQLITDNI